MRLGFRPTFPQHALQAAARNTSEFLSDWRTVPLAVLYEQVGNSFHLGSTAGSMRPRGRSCAILRRQLIGLLTVPPEFHVREKTKSALVLDFLFERSFLFVDSDKGCVARRPANTT
jgi:hypothetical protein